MRIHESGVGLGPLNSNITTTMTGPGRAPPTVMDNQYVAPPPTRRNMGSIDVIGGQGLPTRRNPDSPPKENIIQVFFSLIFHNTVNPLMTTNWTKP